MSDPYIIEAPTMTAASTMPTNGNPPTVVERIDTLAWLHAEQAHRLGIIATALASIVAQQMQPQIQAAILNQLTGKT